MRRRFVTVAVTAVFAASGATAWGAAAAAPAKASPPQQAQSGVYVALGDSLAAGYQPGLGDDKTGGYVGGVYQTLRSKHRGAKLVNLARSGETSVTMIAGGKCAYAEGSQLAAATKVLAKDKGRVRLVTIDIGANDVQTCVTRTGVIDLPCVQSGLAAVARNVPTIVRTVRAAAGPQAQIVVLNYYNPFLAVYLLGQVTVAQQSVGLQAALNGAIAAGAGAGDAKVADVATAFKSTDWTPTPTPYGTIPTNVAMICGYTWMCAKSDIHANDAGYALIATTVRPYVR
ncbi:SGNH/GDSL hydrolase family protein [Calidifontibacter sp. DB0510]|uniref:SGNH/GDSL hydrolase family protein n=1 Tax=Metallococcus carri TaxID=1656884 RepID=A0A967B1L5_9MICO|nr:SGNH/GDSL hydrolase family protein [Metallococcus carri]NHN55730.1 SGNH/GDSL hydrolase family protein [Metallococcus carri]NOP38581.1 SGNH/GDSL hydrolase family protein [Calidifontibacter sp. DB2511S]